MTLELEKAKALKKRLRAGAGVLAAQVELNDPAVVEILGDVGFDVLVIDAEHSPHGPENMQAMLQAGLASDAVVLARPLRLDPDLIRLLPRSRVPGRGLPVHRDARGRPSSSCSGLPLPTVGNPWVRSTTGRTVWRRGVDLFRVGK